MLIHMFCLSKYLLAAADLRISKILYRTWRRISIKLNVWEKGFLWMESKTSPLHLVKFQDNSIFASVNTTYLGHLRVFYGVLNWVFGSGGSTRLVKRLVVVGSRRTLHVVGGKYLLLWNARLKVGFFLYIYILRTVQALARYGPLSLDGPSPFPRFE